MTPIPKEGDKCNFSNYRPISVLQVFSKVFERVADTQLYDYLENSSFLHKQQYGFYTGHFYTIWILHKIQNFTQANMDFTQSITQAIFLFLAVLV